MKTQEPSPPAWPEPLSARVIVPMPPTLIRQIDRWQHRNELPSRAEAIRQLLAAAIATWPKARESR